MGTPVLQDLTVDTLEQQLIFLESYVAQARARQLVLLRELDRRQTPLGDGCHSLGEWAAGRLDLAPETAKTLVAAVRLLEGRSDLEAGLAEGDVSFDRATATARLAAAGATHGQLDYSRGLDITGVRRLAAAHRRMSRPDERQTFSERYLTLQPTLDRTGFRLWGQLPGLEGETVETALFTRAESFPLLPDGTHGSVGQRNVDALISICQDSLDTTSRGHETVSPGPVLSVFTNGGLAAQSTGEAGSVTTAGISVGVSTIEEILCSGKVEHTVIADGQPLAVGRISRVIPPKLGRYVLYRDGGCTADGCTSRYRLQSHYRIPWSQGGATDPDNLTTLCWFHHHVVIHQMGYTIKPDSPPGRLGFNPPGHDPP